MCRRWSRRCVRQAVSDRRGEHRRLADMGLDPYGLTIGADGDRPMFVGAKDVGAKRFVAFDHLRVGMAKSTLALHRKHRHAGIDGLYKGLTTGGPTAMMGWIY
jgi:hypothetical protein